MSISPLVNPPVRAKFASTRWWLRCRISSPSLLHPHVRTYASRNNIGREYTQKGKTVRRSEKDIITNEMVAVCGPYHTQHTTTPTTETMMRHCTTAKTTIQPGAFEWAHASEASLTTWYIVQVIVVFVKNTDTFYATRALCLRLSSLPSSLITTRTKIIFIYPRFAVLRRGRCKELPSPAFWYKLRFDSLSQFFPHKSSHLLVVKRKRHSFVKTVKQLANKAYTLNKQGNEQGNEHTQTPWKTSNRYAAWKHRITSQGAPSVALVYK